MVHAGATVSVLTGKSSDFLKIGVAAAGRGDLDTVSAALAERPDWLRRIGSHGRTMLWEAAYWGRGAMVDYLAERGADIDARGCHFTPLLVEVSPYCAARVKNHDAVAQGLLARGAVVDACTAAYLGDVATDPRQLGRGSGPRSHRASPARSQRPRDGAALRGCRRAPRHRAPCPRPGRRSPSLRLLAGPLLHLAAACRHPRGADRRRPRPGELRAAAFRPDRQGDHRAARSPWRVLWPGSRRGRLAADRLPGARRPGRQRGARARAHRARGRRQRPQPQGPERIALCGEGGLRGHRGAAPRPRCARRRRGRRRRDAARDGACGRP